MNKRSFFVVGKHAVIEALKNPNRKVLRLFLTEESKKKYTEKMKKQILLKTLKYILKLKKSWINIQVMKKFFTKDMSLK